MARIEKAREADLWTNTSTTTEQPPDIPFSNFFMDGLTPLRYTQPPEEKASVQNDLFYSFHLHLY